MRELKSSLQQFGEFILKAHLVREKAAPYYVRWTGLALVSLVSFVSFVLIWHAMRPRVALTNQNRCWVLATPLISRARSQLRNRPHASIRRRADSTTLANGVPSPIGATSTSKPKPTRRRRHSAAAR